MEMQKPEVKVMFICLGNICRSAAAHCIIQQLLDRKQPDNVRIKIESSGTGSYHVGESPNRDMQKELKKRKIPVIGKARALQARDIDNYNLFLTMDNSNLSDAEEILSMGAGKRLRPMLDFLNDNSKFSKYQTKGVPDPYYVGGFDIVCDMLQEACTNLIEYLNEHYEEVLSA